MSTPTLTKPSINIQVADWLKDNPGTNLKDAKKALGVTKDLKLKSGNLTDKRSKITVSDAKGSREASRNRARWLKKSNEFLTKEQKTKAKAIKDQALQERRALQERWKKGEIPKEEYDRQRTETDHDKEVAISGKQIDDLDALLEQGKITQEKYNKARQKLHDLGIGDNPEKNLVNIPGEVNREKTVGVRDVQKRLGEMEKENPSETPDWERVMNLYKNAHLLKSAVSYSMKYGKPVVKTGINWAVKAYIAHSLMH